MGCGVAGMRVHGPHHRAKKVAATLWPSILKGVEVEKFTVMLYRKRYSSSCDLCRCGARNLQGAAMP